MGAFFLLVMREKMAATVNGAEARGSGSGRIRISKQGQRSAAEGGGGARAAWSHTFRPPLMTTLLGRRRDAEGGPEGRG